MEGDERLTMIQIDFYDSAHWKIVIISSFKSLNQLQDTSSSFSWNHRCVAIRSSFNTHGDISHSMHQFF